MNTKNMSTRSNMLPLSALLMLFAAISAVSAQGVAGALSIENLNIAPNPIVAGSSANITFQLYNNYNYELQNVNLELEGTYPLLNFSPSHSYMISTLGEGLYGNINTYLTYTVNVPTDAPTGEYTLDLVGTYQTTETTQSSLGSSTQSLTGESVLPISIYVHGVPSLIAGASSTSSINPGEPFSITFVIQNNGGGEAKNITVSFANANSFSLVGSSKMAIGLLPAGGDAEAVATYTAASGIENGTYIVPLHVSYLTDLNKEKNVTFNVSVSVVVNTPEIAVSVAGSMPPQLYQGYNQSVELLVQNIGYGTARNVTLSITSFGNTSITSSVKKFFIGILPPGGSAEESIFVSTTSSSSAEIFANATYYSSNYRNNYSKNFAFNLSVSPTAQFSVAGPSSSVIPGATSIPITYTIKNTGDIAATGIEVSFQGIYPVTPVDGNGYIAELLPGQSANVTFIVSIDSSATPGNYPVTLYEQWKQPNGTPNQMYAGSQNYYITVSSLPGSSNGATETTIIVVVIVIIIAYAMSRSRRKKKQQKK